MDMNEYCLHMMARERLRDLCAAAARQQLVARVPARRRRSLRRRVGRALIRLGVLAAGTPRIATS
jgi:hypothetical protein